MDFCHVIIPLGYILRAIYVIEIDVDSADVQNYVNVVFITWNFRIIFYGYSLRKP